MLNVFYDWAFGTWSTPNIGFGVGYGRNHSDAERNNFATGTIEAVQTTTGNLAWSLMAGGIRRRRLARRDIRHKLQGYRFQYPFFIAP